MGAVEQSATLRVNVDAKRSIATLNRLEKGLRKIEGVLLKQNKTMAALANTSNRTVKGMTTGFTTMASVMRNVEASFWKMTLTINNLGYILGFNLGIDSLKKATHAASSFERQLKDAAYYGKLTNAQMLELKGNLLDLSKTRPFKVGETVQGFQELLKAGVSYQQASKVIEPLTFAKMLAGDTMDFQDLSNLIIQIVNKTGMQYAQTKEIVDTLIMGANISVLDLKDFSVAFNAAGASLGLMKQPLETMVAMLTSLRDVGQQAAQSGAGLGQLFSVWSRWGRMLQEGQGITVRSVQSRFFLNRVFGGDKEELAKFLMDSEGNMRNAIDMFEDLERLLLQLEQAERKAKKPGASFNSYLGYLFEPESRAVFQSMRDSVFYVDKNVSKRFNTFGRDFAEGYYQGWDAVRAKSAYLQQYSLGSAEKYAEQYATTAESIKKMLDASIDSFKILLAEGIFPMLKSAGESLTKWFQSMSEAMRANPAIAQTAAKVGALATAITALVLGFSILRHAYTLLIAPIQVFFRTIGKGITKVSAMTTSIAATSAGLSAQNTELAKSIALWKSYGATQGISRNAFLGSPYLPGHIDRWNKNIPKMSTAEINARLMELGYSKMWTDKQKHLRLNLAGKGRSGGLSRAASTAVIGNVLNEWADNFVKAQTKRYVGMSSLGTKGGLLALRRYKDGIPYLPKDVFKGGVNKGIGSLSHGAQLFSAFRTSGAGKFFAGLPNASKVMPVLSTLILKLTKIVPIASAAVAVLSNNIFGLGEGVKALVVGPFKGLANLVKGMIFPFRALAVAADFTEDGKLTTKNRAFFDSLDMRGKRVVVAFTKISEKVTTAVDKFKKFLGLALGGAGVGMLAGGPVGAAIGAGIGLFVGYLDEAIPKTHILGQVLSGIGASVEGLLSGLGDAFASPVSASIEEVYRFEEALDQLRQTLYQMGNQKTHILGEVSSLDEADKEIIRTLGLSTANTYTSGTSGSDMVNLLKQGKEGEIFGMVSQGGQMQGAATGISDEQRLKLTEANATLKETGEQINLELFTITEQLTVQSAAFFAENADQMAYYSGEILAVNQAAGEYLLRQGAEIYVVRLPNQIRRYVEMAANGNYEVLQHTIRTLQERAAREGEAFDQSSRRQLEHALAAQEILTQYSLTTEEKLKALMRTVGEVAGNIVLLTLNSVWLLANSVFDSIKFLANGAMWGVSKLAEGIGRIFDFFKELITGEKTESGLTKLGRERAKAWGESALDFSGTVDTWNIGMGLVNDIVNADKSLEKNLMETAAKRSSEKYTKWQNPITPVSVSGGKNEGDERSPSSPDIEKPVSRATSPIRKQLESINLNLEKTYEFEVAQARDHTLTAEQIGQEFAKGIIDYSSSKPIKVIDEESNREAEEWKQKYKNLVMEAFKAGFGDLKDKSEVKVYIEADKKLKNLLRTRPGSKTAVAERATTTAPA